MPGRRGLLRLAAAVVFIGGIAALLVLVLDDEGFRGESIAFDGRSPRAAVGERVRILVELQRPSLGQRVANEGPLDPGIAHAHVRDLERESRALRGALEAKGVRLRRFVLFSRVWSGFAATVDTEDLPEVQTLGVNAEPVRRFYPATAAAARKGTVPFLAQATPEPGGSARPPVLALLDSGVELEHPDLRARVVPGYDAVGGDRDARPGTVRGRRDEHGTQIAGVLTDELDRGERILAVRVAGVQADAETGTVDEFATTDQLLAGLEYVVDPDRDGDTSDRVPIALSAVNSPYAGFLETPEAEAVGAARGLGTLVVAPAGNEGAPGGRFGTVGSPAAAEGTLAVGALDGAGGPAMPEVDLALATEEGRARLDGALLSGGGPALRVGATALGGASQADPRHEGAGTGGSLLEYFSVEAQPRARGRAVVVPREAAGRDPALAARAAAAASAGAAALIVCDPDGGELRPLPRAAGGGMPVIGLSGEDAERALELVPGEGGLAFVSEPHERDAGGDLRVSGSSSRGPTYGLTLKPELVAPGSARTAAAGGEEAFVSGTSVAAARVAAAAVRLHRLRPDAAPAQVVAALVGSGERLDPVGATGGGEVSFERARAAPVIADPAVVSLSPQRPGQAWTTARELTFTSPANRQVDLRLRATTSSRSVAAVVPATVRVPPGETGVTIQLQVRSQASPPGFVTGRLTAEAAAGTVTIPFAVAVGDPPPAALGELRLTEEDGARGVRFVAGAVEERDGGLAVDPLGELVLRLVREGGGAVRELTPPGGAADLLPGEYAYTLTDETLDDLPEGTYRFEARARGPAGGAPIERRSASFEVR